MKSILHIIPYHKLYPPQNGGQLRCFHLMDQLARHHKMDVLLYQSTTNIKDSGYSNSNITFYNSHSVKRSTGLWSILPASLANALRYRWMRRSFKGPAQAVVLDFAHVVKYLGSQKKYDAVVFEHSSSMMLAPIVKRYMPQAMLIVDAHNIDYKLVLDSAMKIKIKHTEENFYKDVDEFWACSSDDVAELELMNNKRIKGTLVPNGVDGVNKPYKGDKSGLNKKLLFCGSLNYEPNKEGLLWFYDNVWPIISNSITDIELTIIGRGDISPFRHFVADSRINLVGEVDEVTPYYEQSFTAIVPLLSGSGTRLKILEAMSFGNPVVSTSIGIEGINAENGKEALVYDTAETFAEAVVNIINNPSLGDMLRNNARMLVDKYYDWNVIGDNLKYSLCKL